MTINPLKLLKRALDARDEKGFDPNRRIWRRKHIDLWKSNDGCVVRINALEGISNALNSIQDERYGWTAYGPGGQGQAVTRRNPDTGHVELKRFKTADEAIYHVDKMFQFKPTD